MPFLVAKILRAFVRSSIVKGGSNADDAVTLTIKKYLSKKQHGNYRQQAKIHIKAWRVLKMKAKKVVTGAVAALSFLALAATGVFAAGELQCKSGTVVAVGSGYAYPYLTNPPTVTAGQRTVTLSCENPSTFFATAALDTNETAAGGRAFLVPSTPDKDGVYAAALTALVEGRPVEFWVSSTAKSIRKSSTSYQRSYIRVLNVLPAAAQ